MTAARVGLARRVAVLCLLATAVTAGAPADAAPTWIAIQTLHATREAIGHAK